MNHVSMIERVAITLYNHGSPTKVEWPVYVDDRLKTEWRRIARIAITCMREPTEAMIINAEASYVDAEPEEIWREMIDAALAEGVSEQPAA
jgi:hypothetical protein